MCLIGPFRSDLVQESCLLGEPALFEGGTARRTRQKISPRTNRTHEPGPGTVSIPVT
jgi:hypothetical protein